MSLRGLVRDQVFLLPPRIDDWLPDDHAARFVAMFVDNLRPEEWMQLGVKPNGEPLGAPAYHPRLLLGVWLYGFLAGERRARRLEVACREQIPFLWLAGMQQPDHNTLWRFYQQYAEKVRELFRCTIRTAVQMGLLDLAVQAVDGTKVAGNAAKDRTYNAEQLRQLLERVEQAIAELERQNREDAVSAPPRLPQELADAEVLRERLMAALGQVMAAGGPERVNLTDPDATLMKGRQGFVAGFNAQAMVSPLAEGKAGRTGFLITAADVVMDPEDHAQLVPMIDAARELSGEEATFTLADAGYHSGPNLTACGEQDHLVLMPESSPDEVLNAPYHKDRFLYNAEEDTYTCPEGQTLRYAATKRPKGGPVRVYRAGVVCRGCPAFGSCTTNKQQGRSVQIGPDDALLRQQRELMRTAAAKERYRQRKILAEPVFGILKEQYGMRRFWVRGLRKVQAAWTMTAAAFNLRTLYEIWRLRPPDEPWRFAVIGQS